MRQRGGRRRARGAGTPKLALRPRRGNRSRGGRWALAVQPGIELGERVAAQQRIYRCGHVAMNGQLVAGFAHQFLLALRLGKSKANGGTQSNTDGADG